MAEFVDIVHSDTKRTARVGRSALPHYFAKGYVVQDDDAPAAAVTKSSSKADLFEAADGIEGVDENSTKSQLIEALGL